MSCGSTRLVAGGHRQARDAQQTPVYVHKRSCPSTYRPLLATDLRRAHVALDAPRGADSRGGIRTTSDRAPSARTFDSVTARLTPARLRFEPDGRRLVGITSFGAPDLCRWSPYNSA